MTTIRPLLGTLVLWLLTACATFSPSASLPPSATPTRQPTAVLPTAISPTAVATETAVPPTPTNTPSPPPTATPLPVIVVAAPPAWVEAAETAVAARNQIDPTWHWQIAAGDQAGAHIRLVNGEEGVPVHRDPLALAVPFITNWTQITLADAEAILANGHTLVTVMSWRDLTPDLKPLRVDGRHPTDPAYPLQESWSLAAEPGYETAAAALAPALQEAMAGSQVELAAVGDIMLDRGLGAIIEQGNLAYPFAQVAPLLETADLTVGNLECALGDVGVPEAKRYPFRAPPVAADALALAGFDIITLANNHAMDYGPEALLQGIDLLRDQGIAPIGAGPDADAAHRAQFTTANGLRLAFLGYVNVPVEASTGFDTQSWTATTTAPGLAWGDPETIRADVTAVRSQADLVIVLLHSGFEYIEEPSEPQVAAAQAAIDAGANLVIGHHTHILQGIDFYNKGVIVYGLGNFAFQIEGPPETAVLRVWLNKSGVHQLELVPAMVQESGQPRPATADEARAIMERVHFLTMILNAR